MGFKVGAVRINGKVEKKVIAQVEQLPAIAPVDKGPEVFGPEHDGVHMAGGGRNHRDMLIEGIDNFKKALADLLHKPGHVKGRDIGPPGGGDDDLVRRFHLG